MQLKTFLLLLTITIGSNCEAQYPIYQTLPNRSTIVVEDTICLPIIQAKKLLTYAQLHKYTDSLLKISEAQLVELKVQVSLLTEKEQELRNYFNGEISNLENQVALYKDQVVGYEKMVKRERRKRFFTSVAGTLATGAVIFLSLKK